MTIAAIFTQSKHTALVWHDQYNKHSKDEQSECIDLWYLRFETKWTKAMTPDKP